LVTTTRLDYVHVPAKDARAVQVCLLTRESAAARSEPPDQFLGSALRQETLSDGASFHFADLPEAIARVDAFIREEMECCPFFAFERWREGGEVVLRIIRSAGGGD